MFTIIGYWTAPADSTRIPAFERDYLDNHVPLAARLPGIIRLGTMKVSEPWQGGEVEHYRIVEVEFESREALEAALKTPEFAAMRRDRQRLIYTYGVDNHAEVGEMVLADLPSPGG